MDLRDLQQETRLLCYTHTIWKCFVNTVHVCAYMCVFLFHIVHDLTSDRELRRCFAVSGHKGNLPRVLGKAVTDGQGVLPANASDGHAGILPQPHAFPGPVGPLARLLQLHTEEDCVTNRNHRLPWELLGDFACKSRTR